MSKIWSVVRNLEFVAAIFLLSLLGGIGRHEAIVVSLIALVVLHAHKDLQDPSLSLGVKIKIAILRAILGVAVALSGRMSFTDGFIVIFIVYMSLQLVVYVPQLLDAVDPRNDLPRMPKDRSRP